MKRGYTVGKRYVFKVTNFQGYNGLLVFINAFFIVLAIMYSIFTNTLIIPMYILIFIFIIIPSIFVFLWLKLFYVNVNERIITVRNVIGVKFSFDISEIIAIRWKITDTNAIHTERILVRTANKHFAVDTAMIGFEEMSEYLLNNIDHNKIAFINKDMRTKSSE